MSPVDAVLGPSDGGDRKLVLAAPWILMNVHSTMIGHLCWTSHVASARGTRVPLRPFNLTFAFQFVAHKNVTRVKLDALQLHGPHQDVVHVWVYEHFCPRRVRQLNMLSGSLQLGAASLQLGAREQHFIEACRIASVPEQHSLRATAQHDCIADFGTGQRWFLLSHSNRPPHQ